MPAVPHWKKQIGVPIQIGNLAAKVYGGPYRDRARSMWGVLVADNVKEQAHIKVPIKDFDIPDPTDVEVAILSLLVLLKKHPRAYIGCGAGLGRTGTFMACLLRTVTIAQGCSDYDPVIMVRAWYHKNAIETKEQEVFSRTFDCRRIMPGVKALARLP